MQNKRRARTAFATAQQTVDVLVDTVEKYDEKSLGAILGPNSYDIVHSGEPGDRGSSPTVKEGYSALSLSCRRKPSLTVGLLPRDRKISVLHSPTTLSLHLIGSRLVMKSATQVAAGGSRFDKTATT